MIFIHVQGITDSMEIMHGPPVVCFAYLVSPISVPPSLCCSPPEWLKPFSECTFSHISIFLHVLFTLLPYAFFKYHSIKYDVSSKIKITFYLSESLLSSPNVQQITPVGPLCISFIRFLTLKSDCFISAPTAELSTVNRNICWSLNEWMHVWIHDWVRRCISLWWRACTLESNSPGFKSQLWQWAEFKSQLKSHGGDITHKPQFSHFKMGQIELTSK